MDDSLRDYQIEMLSKLEKAWKNHRSVMVQMPTGTGKTHLMAAVIRTHIAEGSVLIVAHRRELLDQIRQTINSFGINSNEIVVESIQKLSRKAPALIPALVIVDEAHHALAKTYKQLWEWWPKAQFLGLTATPCRLSGEAFTDLFDTLLQSYSIQKFIDDGWLSDFEYVSVAPGNTMVEKIAGLKKRGLDGDYQTKEMATVMDVPESIEHLYKTYKQFADVKKGIVYAIDREHARHITEYYQAQGVNCCLIDGKTPAEERKRLVTDYLEGIISVLVSIDCFSEGFDAPEVEFIQLARPTLSLSKYLQQVGRGMRVSPGKPHVLILDNVGLYQTFGLPTDEREWNLMFRGKITGKGHQGGEHGFIIREESDKELVNLQMVYIKSRGQEVQHVEVFIENGKYGILRDRQVSCPAQFVSIQRLEPPFFGIATYPFEIYRNRKTVIDAEGRNLNLRVDNYARQEDEWLVYTNETGQTVWWDSIGHRNYPSKPIFEKIGNFEVFKIDDQYSLRYYDIRFKKSEVLTGPHFCIFKDLLLYNDTKRKFRVYMYLKDQIIVNTISGSTQLNLKIVNADGTIGEYEMGMISNSFFYPPSLEKLGLKRYYD